MLDLLVLLAGVDGFEWDDGNVHKNVHGHSVTLREAEELFLTSPTVALEDDRHSTTEQRIQLLSQTATGRRLLAVFTIRNKRIRIISVRDMSRKERKRYEQES